jgi:hypothetical protein
VVPALGRRSVARANEVGRPFGDGQDGGLSLVLPKAMPADVRGTADMEKDA